MRFTALCVLATAGGSLVAPWRNDTRGCATHITVEEATMAEAQFTADFAAAGFVNSVTSLAAPSRSVCNSRSTRQGSSLTGMLQSGMLFTRRRQYLVGICLTPLLQIVSVRVEPRALFSPRHSYFCTKLSLYRVWILLLPSEHHSHERLHLVQQRFPR